MDGSRYLVLTWEMDRIRMKWSRYWIRFHSFFCLFHWTKKAYNVSCIFETLPHSLHGIWCQWIWNMDRWIMTMMEHGYGYAINQPTNQRTIPRSTRLPLTPRNRKTLWTSTNQNHLTISQQPQQVKDIKEFLTAARRKDAKSVNYKKSPSEYKFKVRTSKYLYTLVVADAQKAEKVRKDLTFIRFIELKLINYLTTTQLRQSLPPGLQVTEI